jgi:sugar phosphate permease
VPTPAPDAGTTPPRASITGFLLTFIGLLLIGFSMFAVLAQEGIAGLGVNGRLRVAVGVWVTGWLVYAGAAMGLPGTRWMTQLLGWAGSAVFAILLTLIAAALLFGILRARSRRRDKRAPVPKESRS